MHSYKQVLVFSLLTGIGCCQAVSDVMGWSTMKSLALASHASPAPRVFTSQQHFETFSSRFFVHYSTEVGDIVVQLTPQLYEDVQGPYNRRNAYGAALSYGPVLSRNVATAPMFESVLHYALCESTILSELDIQATRGSVVIHIEPGDPVSRGLNLQTRFSTGCET